jgi:exopolyphosphatase/guanosine-5'-triphosphate,3'-diphosphate pyrophosphatase
MQRIAAIDIGSNAMRMIVGEMDKAGKIQTMENVRLPVRLGADAFAAGRLSESTLRQAVDAFHYFRKTADALQVTRIRAVATSAMRESINGDILKDRVLRATGIEIEVISGEEEARLIHLAVTSAINLENKRAMLIDIGGGSVEVTLSEDGKILSTESYNMGTVRLLNKLDSKKRGDFPFASERQPFHLMVREYAEAARRRIDHEIGDRRIHVCIGTGGNVEEMGKLRQKLFNRDNDKVITLAELQELIEKLSKLSVSQRVHKYNLRPDRADVILPAAIVLQIIAREAKAHQVVIPRVGLKDGILLQLAQEIETGHAQLDRRQIWQSALLVGEKYQFDAAHSKLTAKFAGQIFDQTASLHGLGAEEKILLEVGALLHDIGHFINTVDHEKHGYYILKAHRLIGLSERQQDIVANLVRYHRKAFPSLDDDNFKALAPKDRLTVMRLAALLRLVDGMDVSHKSHVQKLSMQETKKGWSLTLRGRGDFMLEKWALKKRKALFEEVFGVKLEIEEEA